MDLPRLHGIVPPLATPLLADESIDVPAYEKLVEFQIKAGVHGLWILGTTARFDLIPDEHWHIIAETAANTNAGRLPLVLNISDQGTARTLARAKRFDDLPYDYYAALPPWYQPMTPPEVIDYFTTLADELAKPLVIYNAPWISNQLSFEHLRHLADHPRIVGCKDVISTLTRTVDWTPDQRRAQNFSYLQGTDLIGPAVAAGADGFVNSLSNAFPELAVATWNASQAHNDADTLRFQTQFTKLAQATTFGPMLACLEALCRHRGLLQRMLPAPLRPLDEPTARRVIEAAEAIGLVP